MTSVLKGVDHTSKGLHIVNEVEQLCVTVKDVQDVDGTEGHLVVL